MVAQKHLFKEEVKAESEYPYVYVFLERYFGQLESSSDFNQVSRILKDDKVVFLIGSPLDIDQLSDVLPFRLERVGDSYYIATWKDSTGKDLISVSFPIGYELLLGVTKNELEQCLEEMISSAVCSFDSLQVIDPSDLQLLQPKLYQTTPTRHFYLEKLTDVRFCTTREDGNYVFVWDAAYKEQSLSNLFKEDVCKDVSMHVTQSVYGFKTKSYTIPLSKWIDYVKLSNLRVYSAIEEETDSGFRIFVLCECFELGYNHVLSVIVPKSIFENPTEIAVNIHAFIPTHNVKDLYQR